MKTRILWLNPVGTTSMDQPIADLLANVKQSDTEVHVASLELGIPLGHVTYRAYEALTYPEIVRTALWAGRQGFDAMVIGCFYDHGLEEAREVSGPMIVTAPCLASVELATTLATRFSVIVAHGKCIGQMTDRIHAYGAGRHLASMVPLDIDVEDMQADPERTKERMLECADIAVRRDGAEAVVLGCTAEFGFFEQIQEAVGVPVIDAVVAPFKSAEHLAELKRRFNWIPSRVGACEPPPVQERERLGLDGLRRPLTEPIIVA